MQTNLIRISAIPAYVAQKFGLEISRMTAYNWVNKGRRDHTSGQTVMLTKQKIAGLHVVTLSVLDEFIRRTT